MLMLGCMKLLMVRRQTPFSLFYWSRLVLSDCFGFSSFFILRFFFISFINSFYEKYLLSCFNYLGYSTTFSGSYFSPYENYQKLSFFTIPYVQILFIEMFFPFFAFFKFYDFFKGDSTNSLRRTLVEREGHGLPVSSINLWLLFTFLNCSIPVCFSLFYFTYFFFYLSILSCHVTRFCFFSFFSPQKGGISWELIKVLDMISSSSVWYGPSQECVNLGLSSSVLSMFSRASSCAIQFSESPMNRFLERMQAKVLSSVHRYLLMRQAVSMTRLRLLPLAEKMMQQSDCSSASSINFYSFFSFFKFQSHNLWVRSFISLNFRYFIPWLSK